MPDYAATVAKLQTLRNHGSRFGVDRMRRLDAALGSPSERFPAVHVAGTNGKGSVCAMIEAVARAHGLTTGLYTSPHLVRLGERVQVNRRPLSEARIMGFADELFPVAATLEAEDPELAPSFFEFMTAMAFLSFARERVDLGVIETGLGGRLDATNILTPRVCAITSIGLDHTDMLGDTLEKIAGEKAGILKPGVPAVIGLVPPEAERVIRARAAAVGAPVVSVRDRFPDGDYPETNLAGPHQRANAALATAVCELLAPAFRFDPATVRRALAHVDWAARWQVLPLNDGRRFILDVAHNEEGARALDANLAALTSATGRGPVVVTGVLGLDRAKPLLAVLAAYASELILVRPDQERACSYEDLAACVPPTFRGVVRRGDLATLFPGVGVCTAGGPADTVVATGSVYLAGEILSRMAAEKVCAEYATLQDRLPGATNGMRNA